MSSFWGAEVKPEKPYTHTHSPRRGRLRLTQATLGAEVGKAEKGKTNLVQLQCTVKNKEPVYLCALIPGQSVTCHLDLEFEEKFVTFSVLGPRSVHLAGYYVGDVYEDTGDSDTGSDSLQGSDDDFMASDDDDVLIPISHGQMNTDSEDDSDYDEEYDSEDDEDLMYNQGRGKSSVVIEEIQEDEKPVGGEGQMGSKKKQNSENDDNSRLQLAVRTPPAESVESEDEDGFPVSESKKSSKGSSKKEDRKRKSDAINDPSKSSGEVNAENDVVSKKKKKAKDKRNAVDSEKVNDEEKEMKLSSSADTVAAKQKKKKNKKQSASEGVTDEQADKKTITDNDEEPSKEGGKKKKNKKKTQENNGSENQAQTDVMNSASKEQTSPKARTYPNGLIVQTVLLGKPDGKKAMPGKKVFVTYTGKLKNGKIFDSNVGRKPFQFRLGVGEVIKGWDIGVNGMRIGDKRKLTIPPSMGYGNQKAGTIPPNSTLLFDVELVNVQ